MCHPNLEISHEEIGSSGWIRTSNPPVNRMMQVVYLVGSSWATSLLVSGATWCSGRNCSLIVHYPLDTMRANRQRLLESEFGWMERRASR